MIKLEMLSFNDIYFARPNIPLGLLKNSNPE